MTTVSTMNNPTMKDLQAQMGALQRDLSALQQTREELEDRIESLQTTLRESQKTNTDNLQTIKKDILQSIVYRTEKSDTFKFNTSSIESAFKVILNNAKDDGKANVFEALRALQGAYYVMLDYQATHAFDEALVLSYDTPEVADMLANESMEHSGEDIQPILLDRMKSPTLPINIHYSIKEVEPDF